jgi:hypothetical protein
MRVKKGENVMVTLVGVRGNFVDALKELVELEFDTVEAYEVAIDRLKDPEYKITLGQFRDDHKRHISELTSLLIKHDVQPPLGHSMGKHWVTIGKVVIANLNGGDKAILLAIKVNKIDTNTTYARMKERPDAWNDARDIIECGLQDEQRHQKWLEAH